MNWEAQNERAIEWARETAVDRRWYVLQCDPQEIRRLIGLLPHIGVVAFAPMESRTVRIGRGKRKSKTISQPLMTGYLVAGFREPPNWYVTFQLSAIFGVVSKDGRPAVIPPSAMERCFSIHQRPAPSVPGAKSLKAGDTIRVLSGGFEGHEAKLIDIRKEHCEFILDLFGKEHRVRLPIADVEAA